MAGGTARVPGLLDLLKEEFAMPVEELYPFRKVSIVPGRHDETSFANWRRAWQLPWAWR